ncbi:hypothetical protein UA08_09441 [Talaromyces atroroseus]|uniref:Uncharacterized protein n=1 Tax=Talaromyces atroroseus TaxID=1441469 RepID=A0A225A6N1_TALAT|nr:hypothetical protein UA08_09441 [Talaromyces atroroseus]OKL55290.1 hypothetical protein UA08_09441 [Talaromyces atroroseus]
MEESGDSIFDDFLQDYGQGDEIMDDLISKIKFVYRKPPSDDLCDKVQELLGGSRVIDYGGFKWVEPEWDSKEFRLLEKFLQEGARENETELLGHRMRGPIKLVRYIPQVPDHKRSPPRPYLICPSGYDDAAVLVRSVQKETQHLQIYDIDPRTTVQEVQEQIELLPKKYGTTLDNLLLLPHQSKIAWPIENELMFVCQLYSTGGPDMSAASADQEDDVSPFMRRFWWKWSR